MPSLVQVHDVRTPCNLRMTKNRFLKTDDLRKSLIAAMKADLLELTSSVCCQRSWPVHVSLASLLAIGIHFQ
jgi:hypothetical protein